MHDTPQELIVNGILFDDFCISENSEESSWAYLCTHHAQEVGGELETSPTDGATCGVKGCSAPSAFYFNFNHEEATNPAILKFTARGSDITPHDPTYKGDINNHRITAEIEHNGVKFHIEVTSISTKRRTHQVTGAQLKQPLTTSDNNGMSIEINALYKEVLQSARGGYFMHDTERRVYQQSFDDHIQTYHTLALLMRIVNMALKTDFKSIQIETRTKPEPTTVK